MKQKVLLLNFASFLRKSLEVMGEFPIFATSKLYSGQNAAGDEPAIFVPAYFSVNQYGCTVSESSNGPGALLYRLRQRVVQLFYVLKYIVMNQTMRMGQAVQPPVLSSVERTVKNLKAWWNARCESMSEMIGEDCTHGEVVVTNLVFTAGVVAAAIAGTMFGG